jgi:phage-related protein
MDITVQNHNINIKGNIKTIENYMTIKETVQELVDAGVDSLHFVIEDSLSMTSSVIGYLMKLIKIDGVHVSMAVGDERLISLFEELDLVKMFNVHKVY